MRIENLTELEKLNPKTRRDYCYYDMIPTDWIRGTITRDNVKNNLIPYSCDVCHRKAHYTLRTPVKEKER